MRFAVAGNNTRKGYRSKGKNHSCLALDDAQGPQLNYFCQHAGPGQNVDDFGDVFVGLRHFFGQSPLVPGLYGDSSLGQFLNDRAPLGQADGRAAA